MDVRLPSRTSSPTRCGGSAQVADVQLEYSLLSRGVERQILPACRDLGIGVTAYGVLSRGLLSGHWSKTRALAGNDFRAHAPRFTGANLERNLTLVAAMQSIAARRGVTIAQLAIAWVLSRGNDVVPLVGARRRASLDESLAATDVTLSALEIEEIEAAVPHDAAAGERYPTAVLAHMDSEK